MILKNTERLLAYMFAITSCCTFTLPANASIHNITWTGSWNITTVEDYQMSFDSSGSKTYYLTDTLNLKLSYDDKNTTFPTDQGQYEPINVSLSGAINESGTIHTEFHEDQNLDPSVKNPQIININYDTPYNKDFSLTGIYQLVNQSTNGGYSHVSFINLNDSGLHVGGGIFLGTDSYSFANWGSYSTIYTPYIKLDGVQLTKINDLVTTVPEAEEWGMMMLGLGLVNFATRKRKDVTVSHFVAA